MRWPTPRGSVYGSQYEATLTDGDMNLHGYLMYLLVDDEYFCTICISKCVCHDTFHRRWRGMRKPPFTRRQGAHQQCHAQKHRKLDHILGLFHGQCIKGDNEEIVGQEEAKAASTARRPPRIATMSTSGT